MPRSNRRCEKCNNKLTYDKILSKPPDETVWWCVHCDYIEVRKEFHVKDALKSIKRYIFHGKIS